VPYLINAPSAVSGAGVIAILSPLTECFAKDGDQSIVYSDVKNTFLGCQAG